MCPPEKDNLGFESWLSECVYIDFGQVTKPLSLPQFPFLGGKGDNGAQSWGCCCRGEVQNVHAVHRPYQLCQSPLQSAPCCRHTVLFASRHQRKGISQEKYLIKAQLSSSRFTAPDGGCWISFVRTADLIISIGHRITSNDRFGPRHCWFEERKWALCRLLCEGFYVQNRGFSLSSLLESLGGQSSHHQACQRAWCNWGLGLRFLCGLQRIH